MTYIYYLIVLGSIDINKLFCYYYYKDQIAIHKIFSVP